MSVMNKTYKKYSIEEKIYFVKLNETMSAHQIENKYNISRQCLRTWKKNLSKMKALTNKKANSNWQEREEFHIPMNMKLI